MQTAAQLSELLDRIDRRGYPAYKDTRGQYRFADYILSIDHVQGDPFAAPSRLSIRVDGKRAAFPPALYRLPCQRIALQDELTRQFGRQAAQASGQAKGSGHSGLIAVSRCGQEVLERTACRLEPESGGLVLRLEVGFPANGRTINVRELKKILFDLLPRCVQAALLYRNLDGKRLQRIADLAEGSAGHPRPAARAGPVRLCGGWQRAAPGVGRVRPAHGGGGGLPLAPRSWR